MRTRLASRSRRRITRTMLATAACGALVLAGCGGSTSHSSSATTTGAATSSGPAKYPTPSGGNGGSTATGVTGTSINLALMYSITGPAPGVTEGAARGAEAYIDYINSVGGIYGRQLHITPYDDGFDPTKAKADCDQIAPKYFAITGGFSVGDSGCYQEVQSSGIPWIQFYYDNQYQSLPNAYFAGGGNILKEPTTEDAALKSLFPQVTKVAALYEQTPGNSQEQAHINVALKSLGYKVVLFEPISDTIPSYANYVVQLRNSGAQAIFMDASSSFSQSRLAMAMNQQNYHPTFVEAATSYASNWHSLAGAGAAGWTAGLSYLPFLNPAAMSATAGSQLFQQWFAKTNPGKTIDLFAVYGWTSVALMVQGMINAGPDLTRTSALAAIQKIHNWTADGVLAPSDVGGKGYSSCIIVMQSTTTGYTQLLPKGKPGQFDCNVPGAAVIDTPGVPS